MTHDVAAIARRLTKAQREALLSLPRIGGNNPGREYTALLDFGLADCTVKAHENGWDGNGWCVCALELGIAVRRHLEQGATAGVVGGKDDG